MKQKGQLWHNETKIKLSAKKEQIYAIYDENATWITRLPPKRKEKSSPIFVVGEAFFALDEPLGGVCSAPGFPLL